MPADAVDAPIAAGRTSGTSATPATRDDVGAWRPVHPMTRTVLLVGSVLVFFAGLQLYVLSRHTADLFAWTIAVPLMAAFAGGFYWGALPLAIGCGLEQTWARARAGTLGITAFLWATLSATLLHIDKFHIHGDPWKAQSAAWFWISIYVAVPVALTIGVVLQFVIPGDDPPRVAPFTVWYRALLAMMGGGAVAVAVSLVVKPVSTDRWWPWALTPLTARAIGAWILGLGVLWLCAVYENDYSRIRLALRSYLWLVALELGALVRFSDDLRSGKRTSVLVGVLLATALIDIVGMFSVSRRSDARTSP